MKLWKKLMPVATVAATAACVVPMASCGNKALVSTSDFEFTAAKHEKVTEAWDATKATEEYFKDTQNIANDIAVINAAMYKGYRDDFKKEYDNVEYSFNVTVSNITLSEKKEVTLEDGTTKVTGYVASFAYTETWDYKYDYKLVPENISKRSYASKGSITNQVNNAFVYLTYSQISASDYAWVINVYGIKSANEHWAYKRSNKGSSSDTIEYTSGHIDQENDTWDYIYNYNNAKYDDFYNIIGTITWDDYDYLPSNYLSDVAGK